ncbi:hypothetical protein KEC55_32045 [Burkholderia cepacia]|uniref:hypothetical protein n=1 Tax=Burkholderia cepacia TaxID=292 RepID=UPI00249DC4A0|nr:hypothetical protein [Burkholderia cepacia]WGY73403.1 hypothetical protein KEC55_32045 [Burkholderia cepacia]
MSHPISTLGAVHTIVSLVTVAAGLYSVARYRGIDSSTRSARIYVTGMVVSVLTSFGLSSTGGFNVGHALGIVALFATLGGLLVPRIKVSVPAQPYLAQFAFTFSFFLLLIPGINETLTRLPVGHPLANGPESPIVRGSLAVWLGVFVLGSIFQLIWLRSHRSRT